MVSIDKHGKRRPKEYRTITCCDISGSIESFTLRFSKRIRVTPTQHLKRLLHSPRWIVGSQQIGFIRILKLHKIRKPNMMRCDQKRRYQSIPPHQINGTSVSMDDRKRLRFSLAAQHILIRHLKLPKIVLVNCGKKSPAQVIKNTKFNPSGKFVKRPSDIRPRTKDVTGVRLRRLSLFRNCATGKPFHAKYL